MRSLLNSGLIISWRLASSERFFLKLGLAILLHIVFSAQYNKTWATTYYLESANINNASTPGNWNTDPTGGGTGTDATNFTTNGDIFIIISSITGARFQSNVTFGSASSSVTLRIDGDAYIRSGSRTLTIGVVGAPSYLDLTAANSSSLTSGRVSIASESTLQTANTNGIMGTNCALDGTISLTFNANANIEFNGSGTQSMTGIPSIYGSIILSNAANLTQSADLSPGNALIIGSGTTFTTVGVHTLAVAGTSNITGTLVLAGTGAKTFTGDVIINLGGVWNESGSGAITFAGNLQYNGSSYIANSVTHTFSGITKTISGSSSLTLPTLSVSGSIFNSGALIVTTSLTGSGIFTQGTSGNLTISGAINVATFTANGTGNTVTYNGGSAQVIATSTYFDLVINNSSGVTLGGNTIVLGNLTLSSGMFTLSTFDLTVSGSVINATSSKYIRTNNNGKLKLNVGTSAVTFPVGNSTYNPFIISNSGTLDVYGIRVIDAVTAPTANNSTKLINRYWNVTETVANGSNLTLTAQWNSGEENANYTAGTNVKFGYYNGGDWTEILSSQSGLNPYTSSGSYNITSDDLTSGKSFGVGKDDGFKVASPAIAVGSVSAFGNQCQNTTSSEKSYSVSGANLTGDITLTAPTRFEISTTSGSGFGSSVILSPNSGYVNSTTIYVRFLPNAESPFSGNISHTSTGASLKNVSVSGDGVNSPPTVSNPISSNIGATSVDLGGNITSIGCSDVTERGIYWSTSNGFADGSGNKVSTTGSFGTGAFIQSITGLSLNTTYYYKAFATNSGGTVYTSQGNFQTASGAKYSVATGNWNSTSTWSNTSAGAPGAAIPSAGEAVFIEGNDTVTINTNTANSLASLNIAAGTTINYQGNRTVNVVDLIVNGTYVRTSTSNINVSGTMTVGNGGKYIHAVNNEIVPTAAWNSNSTCEITGVTNTQVAGLGQTFGHLIWDCASQNGDKNLPNTGTLSVMGTLTVKNTNASTILFNQSTLSIGGYTQTGGTFVCGVINNSTITNSGNVTISGGTLNIGGTSSLNGTMLVAGNFSFTAGSITENTSGYGAFVFNGSGTQNITTGGTFSNEIRLTVNSGSTVNLGSQVLSGSIGSFTLSSGASIETSHIEGLSSSGATGNVQFTGTRTYSSGAHYIYNGLSAQVTGNGLLQAAGLTINNASGVTLSNAIALNTATLTIGSITAGSILNDGGFQITGTGTLQLTSGTLKIGSGSSATTLPSFGTFNLLAGTAIEYASTATQTVNSNPTYQGLTLSGAGQKNAGGALTINGALIVGSGITLSMSSNQLLGSLSSINNSGTISTNNTSATPIPTGKTWGGTVIYAATSGGQTLVLGTYQTLTLQNTSSSNTLSGDITINTAFNLATSGSGSVVLGSNTLTLGGSINNMDASRRLVANGSSNITINGIGTLGSNLFLDQTVPGTSNRLNNLTYNRASQTITLGDTVEITGTVTPTAGTLATAGVLKLISNSSGTARVAQGSGSYITGNIIAERNIPASARRWRFFGSPVSGATLSDLKNEIYITGAGGATNGFDPTLSNQPSVYSYDETVITGNLNNGWGAATHITNAITVGKGYRIFIRGDRSDTGRLTGAVTTQNEVTVNLIGPLNTGNITLPVSFSSSGIIANDGWNLVCNPYASPFDWNAFYDTQNGVSNANGACINIEPTIYIFNATSNTYSAYNAASNTGTITGGVIPTAAAFWVKATGASPSLILSETYKTAATPIGVFKTNENEGFKIRLEADSISYDEMVVKYMTGSTVNKDNYDIAKLAGTLVNICAYGPDTQYLTGSVRPTVNNANDTIRLGVYASATGNYTLRFYNSEEVAIQENVLLFDTYTSTVTDLLTAHEYLFSVNTGTPATQGDNRFYIVIANNTGLPVELVSFGAQKERNQKVRVNWSTIQEINNDYFEVERSPDGISFAALASISGRGNKTLTQYTWLDEQPQQVNYYRLKQVDGDGTISFSKTVVVYMDKYEPTFQLYPVPAIQSLTASHTQSIQFMRIIDINSTVQLEKKTSGKQVTLNIEHLVSGTYILELTDESGKAFTQRFIKQ